MDLLKSVGIRNLRGDLRIWENIPFDVQRVFTIRNVPEGQTRGNHAHRTCEQILICTNGHMNFEITKLDGTQDGFTLLEGQAFHLLPLNWIQIYKWTEDAVLLVLCSEPYRASEVITDFEEFNRMIRE